jgi:hypothetical protein
MKLCHACKRELSLGRTVGRKDECPFCRADLHSCLNCSFFNNTAPKQCREPAVEPVKEKGRANYCDYFVFAESRIDGAQAGEVEHSRKALDDLFKK